MKRLTIYFTQSVQTEKGSRIGMTGKEALVRIKTGYFNSGHGFDMQLLIDAVGTMGEMLRNGQVSEVVRCKDCKHLFDGEHIENCCDVLMEKGGWLKEMSVSPDWFCANGERKDD